MSHDVTQDDWYKRLKAQSAARKIDEPNEERNDFHVKIKRTYVRRTPIQQRASAPQASRPTKSIMEMHAESMARLRKRFMPPLRKD